jgi:hypothetical protein
MPKSKKTKSVPAPAETRGHPEALSRACHEIIDAAATLIVTVELLAQRADKERRGAADQARCCVRRIVEIAQSMRRATDGAKRAPVPSAPSFSAAEEPTRRRAYRVPSGARSR